MSTRDRPPWQILRIQRDGVAPRAATPMRAASGGFAASARTLLDRLARGMRNPRIRAVAQLVGVAAAWPSNDR